jgi:hypothetical protein
MAMANETSSDIPDQRPLSRRLLILHSVLITLIVVGTLARIGFCFYYNPLESLWSDTDRHYHNGLDVKGEDVESILNAPGFELFMATLLRIAGPNRMLLSMAMAALSAVMPFLWYRWFRELTRDKTVALMGYAIMALLPSWFRIYGYFMDSIILLPLAGAALWLTWRAARKGTWQSCLVAALFCGAACATKSIALPITVLPWLYVGYCLLKKLPRKKAVCMTMVSGALVLCMYGLGPLKVWSHTGCFVLLPDGIYNVRYFESCAHDIEVMSHYYRHEKDSVGEFYQASIWGSSSVCFPPFHPFSKWVSSRQGRYKMLVDYTGWREQCRPIAMSITDRLKYTGENIVYFFFQYQWPEDNDWNDPFPRNYATLHRWLWLPLTVFVFGFTLLKKRRDFALWYFIGITLLFMFQQSAVMEGRYKKLWEGPAIGALLYCVAHSKRYRSWRDCGEAGTPIAASAQPVATFVVPPDEVAQSV